MDARAVTTGLGADLLAVLSTADSAVFVKGIREDDPRVWSQQVEADLSRHAQPLAPRLLWRVQDAGWDVLGFEYISGNHAKFEPGSPDLPKVADALRRLSEIRAPECLEVRAEWKWARFLGPEHDPALLHGDHLVHGDINPFNFLIGDTVRMVDWGWSSHGPAWITPCLWALSLMIEGHTPLSAEEWARKLPAWADAPPESINAFAEAIYRLWVKVAHDDPGPGRDYMAEIAQNWLEHRGITTCHSRQALA